MFAANAEGKRLAYELWDVFTATPLGGNQLAVFLDARGLTTEQMQSLAREMNFSESTFILPRTPDEERAKGVHVRIFSRTAEMPFAGHPTLGTAMAIWHHMTDAQRKACGGKVVLEMIAGRIPVVFSAKPEGTYGEMTQNDPVFAETHTAERIAPLLGISAEQIVRDYPIENVSTGRPNLIVMLDSLKTIRTVKVNWPEAERYFSAGDKQRGFYLMTREVETPAALFHARKPTAFGDDPATGSAAGCAAAWLVKHGLVASGKQVALEQGNEVQRPGRLLIQASRVGDKITDVRVGGFCARVAEGMVSLG